MSLTSWLRESFCRLGTANRKRRRAARSAPLKRTRPQLESLEDRRVPAYAMTALYLSEAVDLNEAGQVVGYAGDHAILLDNDNWIDLGTLGGDYSYAWGINDLGQVVGSSALSGDANLHAFLITPQGGEWFRDSDLDGRNDLMFDLGTLPFTDYSNATDINNAGRVVGNSGGNAFLWDQGIGMINLGAGAATAINEVGQVTGNAVFPFLWDAENGMTILDPGPGNIIGSGESINDAGEIVGNFWVDNGYWTQTGFVWHGGYGNNLSHGHTLSSSAADINNSGLAVGSITVDYDTSDTHPEAVLWHPNSGGVAFLQNQIPPGSDVILESAQAINDSGAILALGYDRVLNWYNTYLLTPIPPSPARTIRITDAPSVTEGNTGTRAATFTVTLSAASNQTVTVAYATANGSATAGSDYQSASGTLTFAPGETSKTITVPVIGDRLGEPNETFFVNLSGATNATIADGQGVAIIVDDEPRISISDRTKAEGRKGKTTLFTFTVTLSATYDQAVTMSFQTVNGTATTSDNDYLARTGTLTFAPGETTKTITIEVKGDSKREANETFYLDVFGNSSNSLFAKNRGFGTILNDD